MKLSCVLVAAATLLGGCSDRRNDGKRSVREPPRERRVIEPPVGIVRALPPHLIRPDGVGPYRLGERLSDLLQQLPSGPRIALFEIPGLLHRSLIRTEDDTVLIGGEPGGIATTVTVLGPEVARTESGIHVGSTRAEVLKALGPPVEELDRARDPRMIAPSALPNARFIFEGERVAAIVVASDGTGAPTSAVRAVPRDAGTDTACPRPASTARSVGACLTGAGELVEIGDNEITVRAAESERVIAKFSVPNKIVFALPLRTADGRDELAVVMEAEDEQVRRWILSSYRFTTSAIRPTIDKEQLYQLSASNARWIGADLREVDLYLELAIRSDAIEVGGLLTTRVAEGKTWRDVVVISTTSATRRPGKSASSPDATDAGASDAGTDVSAGSGANPAKP